MDKINFSPKQSNWMIFSLIALIGLFVLLRWNSFLMPLERDEGEYAYSAWIMRQGVMPYENAFMQKPPMIIYTYMLAQTISPAIWLPRAMAAIFSFAAMILVGLVVKKDYGARAGLLAMWLYALMSMLPHLAPFAANTEIFMNLPVVGLLALYRYYRQKSSSRVWLFAGALSALALMYKPICLFILLIILTVWIAEEYRANRNIVKHITMWAVGTLMTSLIVLSPFLIHDGGRSFWETAIVFNRYYSKQFGYGFDALLFRLKQFWQNWPLVILLTGYFAHKRPRRWWYYIVILLVAMVSIYQSWIGHYYLMIMPFWAIAAAAALSLLIDSIKLEKEDEKFRPALFNIASTVLVLSMIWPIRAQFVLTPVELSRWVYGTVNPFVESVVAAEKLREITNKDDGVLVAGSEPQILYYAERRSVSRFVITYPLIMDTAKRADYQNEAIEEVEKERPKAIVMAMRKESGLWDEDAPRIFLDYLNNKISQEYDLAGGYVWLNNSEGRWQERISEGEKLRSSLILYRLRDEKK